MTVSGLLFISRIIFGFFALIYPVVYFGIKFFLGIRNVITYIRDHALEMKALRIFQKDNFLSTIKQGDDDDAAIFLGNNHSNTLLNRVSHAVKKSQKSHGKHTVTKGSKQLTQLDSQVHNQIDNQKEKQVEKSIEQQTDTQMNSIANGSVITTNRAAGKATNNSTFHHSPTANHKKIKKRLEMLKAKAQQYRTRGQFDQYEKTLIEGMALEEGNKFIFKKLLADWYFSIQNFKKALTLLKQILANDPKHHKSLWQVGEIHLEKGEFDIAKMLVQKAIDSAPQNPKYYITMIEILYNNNNIDQALALMHKVVKLRPTNVSYLMGLANLLEQSGDTREAQTYYLKVIHIDPSNDKARRKLRSLKSK